MRVWIQHSDRPALQFEVGADGLIDVAAVCKQFLLDPNANLHVSGVAIEMIAGKASRTLDSILGAATEGGDGTTKDNALIIREDRYLWFRHQKPDGSTDTVGLFSDGLFDLQDLCSTFGLDPSSAVRVAGLRLKFTDKGRSLHTVRKVQGVGGIEDGSSRDTAFTVEGSPATTPGLAVIPDKFKAVCSVSSPSAEVATLEGIERTLDSKLFKDMRAERGMPIALGARAFGTFIDTFNSKAPLEAGLLAAALDLRDRMKKFYRTEALRRQEFAKFLESYLDDDKYVVVANRDAVKLKIRKRSRDDSSVRRTPDVQVKARILGILVVLLTCEVKPEMGFNGEPLLEALFYYGTDAAESVVVSRHHYTGCPELIVELVGPNIRVGGAIYHDKAIYQPLTDFLSLLDFEDDAHLFKLMRFLHATRQALKELVKVYTSALTLTGVPVRVDTLHWPYALGEKYPDAAAVHQIKNTLVYMVTTGSGQRRVVKFVRQYGEDAHAQWEQAGYAPHHTIEQLPGDWKMVDMDCLTAADGWRSLLELRGMEETTSDTWKTMQDAVWQALLQLQALQPTMVHGDLRLNNIMYNVQTGQPCFLDFDWAGQNEMVHYPLNLSSKIAWPAGATPMSNIKAIHDRELLQKELEMILTST